MESSIIVVLHYTAFYRNETVMLIAVYLYTLTKWQVIFRIMTGKVLLDMTPCPLVNSYLHFGGACLHLQGQCSAFVKCS